MGYTFIGKKIFRTGDKHEILNQMFDFPINEETITALLNSEVNRFYWLSEDGASRIAKWFTDHFEIRLKEK